jgi:hypothetical protein
MLTSQWENRLKITQPSFKVREPVLNLHLQLCSFHGLTKEIPHQWLQIAHHARSSQQLSRASYALLKAVDLSLSPESSPQYNLQTAKLIWRQGNQYQAVAILQKEVRSWPSMPSTMTETGKFANEKIWNFFGAPTHFFQEKSKIFIAETLLFNLQNGLK